MVIFSIHIFKIYEFIFDFIILFIITFVDSIIILLSFIVIYNVRLFIKKELKTLIIF